MSQKPRLRELRFEGLAYIMPWCIFCLGVYFKLLGLDVYSAFPLSLPLCILGLGVYFKQLGLQVFRPTSQSMVLQSTLQPSARVYMNY